MYTCIFKWYFYNTYGSFYSLFKTNKNLMSQINCYVKCDLFLKKRLILHCYILWEYIFILFVRFMYIYSTRIRWFPKRQNNNDPYLCYQQIKTLPVWIVPRNDWGYMSYTCIYWVRGCFGQHYCSDKCRNFTLMLNYILSKG